jgi:hypothetical protein
MHSSRPPVYVSDDLSLFGTEWDITLPPSLPPCFMPEIVPEIDLLDPKLEED